MGNINKLCNVSLASMILAGSFMSASVLATQSPTACPTLAKLGVTQFTNTNASLPLWEPGTPQCVDTPSDEHCYATWNLTQQSAALEWTFFVNYPGKDPSDALQHMNSNTKLF